MNPEETFSFFPFLYSLFISLSASSPAVVFSFLFPFLIAWRSPLPTFPRSATTVVCSAHLNIQRPRQSEDEDGEEDGTSIPSDPSILSRRRRREPQVRRRGECVWEVAGDGDGDEDGWGFRGLITKLFFSVWPPPHLSAPLACRHRSNKKNRPPARTYGVRIHRSEAEK